MKEENIERNRPSEEGRKDDPNVRDESALQPGISTVSSSNTDEANEKLTETAADSFRKDSKEDGKADPDFDQ